MAKKKFALSLRQTLKFKMMRKLFLLFATCAIGAMSATAQLQDRVTNAASNRAFMEGTTEKVSAPGSSTYKTTAPTPRNYDHQGYVESISSPMLGSSLPIWQDSSIRVNYSSGLGSINFTSVCQVIVPFDNLWNEWTNPNFLGQTAITATNSYTVDSVSLAALYFIGSKGLASTVDTLEISLAYQAPSAFYFWRKATSAWAAPYLPATKDTLKWISPYNVDSVRKIAKSFPFAGTSFYSWKQPLTASMRTATSVTSFSNFAFKVPATFTVPAGNALIVTYTFRTGGTWIKNSDTVTERHNFRAGFAYNGTSSASTPMKYAWYDGDRSGSSVMFSTDTNFYAPTLVIGAVNNPAAWYAQYLLSTVTLSCASCDVVKKPIGGNIKESSLFADVKAFPNPANAELNIPFTVNEKSTVTVSITNMVGQVIATQNIEANANQAATATFNTSNLASGIYLYTLKADGQQVTNRFSVAH